MENIHTLSFLCDLVAGENNKLGTHKLFWKTLHGIELPRAKIHGK
jgi:hypothetical protein